MENFLQTTQDIHLENDYYFLSDDLKEKARELLIENNFTFNDDFNIFYSLSYCQGDGVCFDNLKLIFDNGVLNIKQSGHYYHYNSMNFDFSYDDDEDFTDEIEKEIIEKIKNICKELEKYGYNLIEAEDEYENKRQVLINFFEINNIELEAEDFEVYNKKELKENEEYILLNNNNLIDIYIRKEDLKELKEHIREIKTFEDGQEISARKELFYNFNI